MAYNSPAIQAGAGITVTQTATGQSIAVTNPVSSPVTVPQGGTGDTTITGLLTGNGTSPITGTAITQYNVITGGATNLPNSVAPSATSGVPLISQGAGAQPIFGTVVVAGGGTGAVTLTGLLTGNGTSSVTGTAITQYNVLTGGATNLPNSVAPSATSGVPLISQGAASQPVFGTAVVAGGGTGATTFTSNGVLLGNTTSAVTATAAGTDGQLLIGSSAGAPAFATVTGTGGITFTTGNNSLAINMTVPITVSNGGTGRTTLTTHGVLVGAGTSAITQLAAGSAGQVLQSGGAGADPAYSTATYPLTTTVNQILYSSATNTVGGLATTNSAGLVTTSSGAPTWIAFTSPGFIAANSGGVLASRKFTVKNQVFTSSGTYTPTTGMLYCQVTCLGGGGAGGGAVVTGAAAVSVGGGGGSGQYGVGIFSAATIGASQTVTIGAAGTGNSGATGGNGGTTSLGALISAGGGSGGTSSGSGATAATNGGAGGSGGTGGDYIAAGTIGFPGLASVAGGITVSGQGASSQLGSGGQPNTFGSSGGSAAGGYGAGGSGGLNQANQAANTGGNGVTGILIVTEYIIN
jgi:hypothetical protein